MTVLSVCSRTRTRTAPLAEAAWLVLALLCLLGALLAPAVAHAQSNAQSPAAPSTPSPAPLVLDALQDTLDAWPAVRLLSDPDHALTAEQALAALDRFTAPTGPHANLGRREDTVWLHIPVQLRGGTPDWWLAVDYPALDVVELNVVRDGRVLQRVPMGDHLALGERPVPTRLHAAALKLGDGERAELLLRVRTSSAALLPITLKRTKALVRDEGRTTVTQGLLVGLGLALLLYTVVGLAALRDLLYVWFGLAALASTLFFAAYFGVAALWLWPENAWLTRNAAPLMMILVLGFGTLFVDRSLEMSRHAVWASRALRGVATVALVAALLFITGAIGYRAASAVAGVLGLLPMLIALPVAWRLARAGDRIARWTFAGWLVYSIGVVTMTLLHGGRVAYSDLTVHAMQAGSLVEMLAWLVILGLRADQIRRQAARAQRENERLLMMAHTDPLTGLLNRRGLEQTLRERLLAVDEQALAAIYVLDLDGFKAVNDTHGHSAGDELLVQMAVRLKRAVRSTDLVARTGGDEFIVMVGDLKSPREAEQVGQKLLACCDNRFELSGSSAIVGMTVGYALAPLDGHDGPKLIERADAAMYTGKQAGKHRVARAGGGLAPV